MKIRLIKLIVILLISFIFIISCTQKIENNSQLANPASVYCEEQGQVTQNYWRKDGI